MASKYDSKTNNNDLSKGQNHLFVIAIDKYKSETHLNNCVSDASALINVLIERYCFEEEQIVFLKDDLATIKNIIEQLGNYAKKLTANDNLVIFFSGHGSMQQITKKGFWKSYDFNDNLMNGIRFGEILELINIEVMKAMHILIIADSCFGGAIFNAKDAHHTESSESVEVLEKKVSRWAITAGSEMERVSDGIDRSPFAKYLIECLQNNDKPSLKSVTLGDQIQDLVRLNYPNQTPLNEPLQGVGHSRGQFIFHLRETLSEDHKYYNEIIKLPTIEKATFFIEKFNNSPFIGDVIKHLLELEEANDWADAKKRDTYGGYFRFMHKYPSSKFSLEAKKKASPLKLMDTKANNPVTYDIGKNAPSQLINNEYSIKKDKINITYKYIYNRLIRLTNNTLNCLKQHNTDKYVEEFERFKKHIDSNQTLKILVIGEFNVGKSTLINAFLGTELLPSKPIPSTAITNHITYAEKPSAKVFFRDAATKDPIYIPVGNLYEYLLIKGGEESSATETGSNPFSHAEIKWPLENYQDSLIEIIDTPGISEKNTRDMLNNTFIPEIDIVVLVMSAVNFGPTNAEKEIINILEKSKLKNLFFVVNKWDLQTREANKNEIEKRAQEVLPKLTNHYKGIFFVSAVDALEGRITNDKTLLQQSGFGLLESALHSLLINKCGPVKLFENSKELEKILVEIQNDTATNNRKKVFNEKISFINEDIALLTALKEKLTSEVNDLIFHIQGKQTKTLLELSTCLVDFFLNLNEHIVESYQSISEKSPSKEQFRQAIVEKVSAAIDGLIANLVAVLRKCTDNLIPEIKGRLMQIYITNGMDAKTQVANNQSYNTFGSGFGTFDIRPIIIPVNNYILNFILESSHSKTPDQDSFNQSLKNISTSLSERMVEGLLSQFQILDRSLEKEISMIYGSISIKEQNQLQERNNIALHVENVKKFDQQMGNISQELDTLIKSITTIQN